MREELVMLIVMPTMFVVTGWAFKTLLNFIQQRQLTKLHYALQDKLLEKLGSSPEAVQYLHSDAGEKMFALASKERTNPYARILSALQAGAVLCLLGIGFVTLSYTSAIEDAAEGFIVIGVLGISLGLGFLASSASAYVFSKNWGLINGSSAEVEG
jgi:hypothetical protein